MTILANRQKDRRTSRQRYKEVKESSMKGEAGLLGCVGLHNEGSSASLSRGQIPLVVAVIRVTLSLLFPSLLKNHDASAMSLPQRWMKVVATMSYYITVNVISGGTLVSIVFYQYYYYHSRVRTVFFSFSFIFLRRLFCSSYHTTFASPPSSVKASVVLITVLVISFPHFSSFLLSSSLPFFLFLLPPLAP